MGQSTESGSIVKVRCARGALAAGSLSAREACWSWRGWMLDRHASGWLSSREMLPRWMWASSNARGLTGVYECAGRP